MPKHAVLAVATLAVCLMGAGKTLTAQKAPPPAPSPFASIQTLKCSFSSYAVNNWQELKPNTVTASEDFSFQISVVNVKKGRARIIGSTGAIDVALVISGTGLNVIEQTPAGNFTLTTVFAAGGQDGKFLAAHARHVDLAAAPSPSQHYGSCEAVKAQ
ncbi:MAG: hypothetical protein ABI634_19080 [Acidobacteriota bacterium]